MGTTAEKLTYLNGTKRLLRRRLNSLGAEITLETKFRDYLLWLDRFYNAASSSVKFEILGETTQEQYDASYNLLPNNIQSQTINGVTITRNEDGSLTLNGTSTETFGLNFIENFELEAGTYYFNFFESSPLPFTYYVYYQTSSTTYTVSYNKTNTFESDVVGTVRLGIQSGVTFDNLKVYPLITEGSTAKEYRPYGAKPSPSNPSPIVNKTGEITYTASDGTEFPINLVDINLRGNPNPNGTPDKIYYANGDIYLKKNVETHTLTGAETENWRNIGRINTERIWEGRNHAEWYPEYFSSMYSICDCFKNALNSNITGEETAIEYLNIYQYAVLVGNNIIYVKFSDKDAYTEENSFIQWLRENSMTIQYDIEDYSEPIKITKDGYSNFLENYYEPLEITEEQYIELYNQLQAIIDHETKLEIEKKIF